MINSHNAIQQIPSIVTPITSEMQTILSTVPQIQSDSAIQHMPIIVPPIMQRMSSVAPLIDSGNALQHIVLRPLKPSATQPILSTLPLINSDSEIQNMPLIGSIQTVSKMQSTIQTVQSLVQPTTSTQIVEYDSGCSILANATNISKILLPPRNVNIGRPKDTGKSVFGKKTFSKSQFQYGSTKVASYIEKLQKKEKI